MLYDALLAGFQHCPLTLPIAQAAASAWLAPAAVWLVEVHWLTIKHCPLCAAPCRTMWWPLAGTCRSTHSVVHTLASWARAASWPAAGRPAGKPQGRGGPIIPWWLPRSWPPCKCQLRLLGWAFVVTMWAMQSLSIIVGNSPAPGSKVVIAAPCCSPRLLPGSSTIPSWHMSSPAPARWAPALVQCAIAVVLLPATLPQQPARGPHFNFPAA